MAEANFYIILGIPEHESPEGIKRAFRELALRYHPDRAGPRGTSIFREVVRAYETLSDPARRAGYDEGLRQRLDVPRESVTRPWPEPEPLVPEPVSVIRDLRTTRPSRDEVLSRFRRNFSEEAVPKAERMRPLRFVLQLHPTEAAYGGVVTLAVPVFYPCRRCRGTGYRWDFTCGTCGGEGLVEIEEPVLVNIPPGVRDGDQIHIPLRSLGVHNLFLSVLIRV